MSVPFCSVQTMSVSACVQLMSSRSEIWAHTLLFLVAVIFGNARFEQLSRLVVLG
jgi:hypothetical protein